MTIQKLCIFSSQTLGILISLGMLCSPARLGAQTIDFQRDIAAILEDNCWHCHGADEQESGLRLDRRVAMLTGGDSGLAAITPGDVKNSYLLDLVNHREEGLEMPPDEDKLDEASIALLTRWIEQGAVWPGQMQEVVKEKSEHWSFQPIVRPEVPAVEATENPIDAFLAQQLSEQGLSFSQSADPRTLVRRVSIVLTGLPPTNDETTSFTDAYEKDPNSAYATLVERLLASPHFGERWAQHWLDVIRWAETNGSESNLYRKNAWIYRDYVIRAFNDDKPYDDFLFEQIAGDTIGQGDATGYLVSGPHVPIATVGQEPSARRQARADRMDEILQTVGASAMGLTIGCARCHNHKFDPVSIQDYYSMSAVFQDIEYGSRYPELAEDHPRRVRGQQLRQKIARHRAKLKKTGPWEENWIGYRELHFPAAKTQAVRVSFQQKRVRVDELQVFGPAEWRKNLALAKAGTRTESPDYFVTGSMKIHKINDGQFGTESWVAKSPEGSKEKPWVIFRFDEPHNINRIRLSSNREEFLTTDYLEKMNKEEAGPLRVEVQNADGKWHEVYSSAQVDKLNKQHELRKAALKELQRLIQLLTETGPQASFVAKFIEPAKTHVLARGSPENPKGEVFAAGLSELDGELQLPENASGKQRREAFARWLIDDDNPLTARVAANRLWHHVFGQGIVKTTSDFGAAGVQPTHPQLLDWLAAELMQPTIGDDATTPKAWSMKHLIRLMVHSQAFQQASLPRDVALAIDAGAELLWRFPPRRVEAEVIRDAVLQASGSLNPTIGGRSFRIHNVKKRYSQWEVTDNHGSETWRRMIYQERMRRVDDQLFTAFDFPDCGQVRAKRPVSTTPLQALNLMNSDFVIEQAKLIAKRASDFAGGDLRQSVEHCFELLLGRRPTEKELTASLTVAQEHDLSLVCRALINSNEFAFLP